jgi:hypothetical protein
MLSIFLSKTIYSVRVYHHHSYFFLKAYEYYVILASITRCLDSSASLPSHVINDGLLNFPEIAVSCL